MILEILRVGMMRAITQSNNKRGFFMKALIILSLTIVSLNVFGAEVGEEKKTPCPFADQGKRAAKVVEIPVSKEVKEDVKNAAK